MRHKKYAVLCCAVAMLVLTALSGCRLARDGAEAAGTVAEDRLVGVFLTTEHLDLFDFESYLNDNLNGLNGFHGGEIIPDGGAEAYQGRLYAEMTPSEQYVFPVSGIPYIAPYVPRTEDREGYYTSSADPAVSDGHVAYKSDDDGDSITVTGTVYVAPSAAAARTFYFNPVYQSADGSVYATTGSGFMLNYESYSEGRAYSQSLDASSTTTVNGETQTYSASITVSVSVMSAPEKIVVLRMDEQSAVLDRTEYAPDAMPADITAGPDTDYLIVETHKRDGEGKALVSRAIYARGRGSVEDAESAETFFERSDGICEKKFTPIVWEILETRKY